MGSWEMWLINTVLCQLVGVLADQQRAVVSSLQYFKALVDRLGVDKLVLDQSVVRRLLGGASSGVLEAVKTLVQLEPHLHNRYGSPVDLYP